MSGINKVILVGNVGTKKTHDTQAGTKVVNISMATSVKFEKNGEKTEKTSWHNVAFFNKLADIADKYIKVGSKIYIEGSLDYSKYDKDGQTHYATKIIANQLQLLDKKDDSQSAPPGQTVGEYQKAKEGTYQPATSFAPDEYDDLPF